MVDYRISGIWMPENGKITHYAFHISSGSLFKSAKKISKDEAIRIVDTPGNSVYTWIWNYNDHCWNRGEKVQVVNGQNGKYLRSNHDNTVKDNLKHLINYSWIAP